MKQSPKILNSIRSTLFGLLLAPATSFGVPLEFAPNSPEFGDLAQDGTLEVTFTLNKGDKIKEASATSNGTTVEETTFTPFSEKEDLSVSIVYLIDVSNAGRAPAIAAGKSLIEKMISDETGRHEIAIATVFQEMEITSPFGSTKEERINQLLAIKADSGKGNTHLYSGLKTVISDHLQTRPTERKIVVLLSDGMDEEFRGDPAAGRDFRENLVTLAKKHGVSLHTIGFPETIEGVASLEPFRILAKETGGSYFQCAPKTYEPEDSALEDLLMAQIESGGTLKMKLPATDVTQEVRIKITTEDGETLSSPKAIDPLPASPPGTANTTPAEKDPDPKKEDEKKEAKTEKTKPSSQSKSDEEKPDSTLNKKLLVGLLLAILLLILIVAFLLIRNSRSKITRISPNGQEPLDLLLEDESNSALMPDTIPDLAPQRPLGPPLPAAEIEPYSSIEEPSVLGTLVSKNNSQKSFPIRRNLFVVGRSKSADFSVANDSVSNIHALIFSKNKDEVSITDLHSANGIFVNGSKVHQSHKLKNGDLIEFGEVAYVLQLTGHTTS